jgi:hypothetical protein
MHLNDFYSFPIKMCLQVSATQNHYLLGCRIMLFDSSVFSTISECIGRQCLNTRSKKQAAGSYSYGMYTGPPGILRKPDDIQEYNTQDQSAWGLSVAIATG